MPRHASVPKYGLHKGSGQAVTYVNRKPVYLGPFDSPESRRRYGELLAGLESSRPVSAASAEAAPLTINMLCLKFVTEVLPKYKTADGAPNAEQACFKGVVKILRRLFGETAASDFGPVKLRLVRSEMVATGWARKHINKQVSRLRAIFKFAVSWALVPATMIEGLRAVPALEPGETEARETKPKYAVPAEVLKTVRAELLPRHQDVFDLLLLTGARPGELMGLKMGDVNRTVSPWRADLQTHKTAHRGKSRTLYFNATAQSILLKYLKADPGAKLLPIARKTFSEVLGRACDRAEVERFTAHTLRHCVATKITNELGLETAQRLLGHSSAAMTAHYAKGAEDRAVQAATALG